MFIKNEGGIDRLIRVLLGEVFFLLAFFWFGGSMRVIFGVLSAVMFMTAITGFCGPYKLFGINTCSIEKKAPSKVVLGIFITLFITIATIGGYYSNFFTKKFFLEDFNRMNGFYKQTLFNTGQEKRMESIDNYNKLVAEYVVFNAKYQSYHPYAIAGDAQFNADLTTVSDEIVALKDKVNTGDLKSAHLDLEKVRPVFQEIFKRNNFSMLAVSLVDFHDAMEKIIDKANAKDPAGVVAVYDEVSEKLKAVEVVANDAEIVAIRERLNETLDLALKNNLEQLPAKAAELKASFVKVYLKRG